MQYAKMIDLIEKAKEAGLNETEFVNERLAEAFENWLERQNLNSTTEEEEHVLRMSFEEGYGICPHSVYDKELSKKHTELVELLCPTCFEKYRLIA